ncbi:hypothetical protein COD67_23365 [Bacillus cereus]|nr:hypothetical protein COI89_22005 [Bacillus cereus]PGU62086.1 hypothetical protein COD67_23365 [Bacillus cereus]
MNEQKSALSVKVEVDTKEANENIKELTAAANECVEAFERLEKKLSAFSAPQLKISTKDIVGKSAVDFLMDVMSERQAVNRWSI